MLAFLQDFTCIFFLFFYLPFHAYFNGLTVRASFTADVGSKPRRKASPHDQEYSISQELPNQEKASPQKRLKTGGDAHSNPIWDMLKLQIPLRNNCQTEEATSICVAHGYYYLTKISHLTPARFFFSEGGGGEREIEREMYSINAYIKITCQWNLL